MLRSKRDVEDRWSLRPGDLPPRRLLVSDPRLKGIEDNAIFRMMLFRSRKVRFSFLKSPESYPNRFNIPLQSAIGVAPQVVPDLIQSSIVGADIAQAYYGFFGRRISGHVFGLMQLLWFLAALVGAYYVQLLPAPFRPGALLAVVIHLVMTSYYAGAGFFKPHGFPLLMISGSLSSTRKWLQSGAPRYRAWLAPFSSKPMLVFTIILMGTIMSSAVLYRIYEQSRIGYIAGVVTIAFAGGLLTSLTSRFRWEKTYSRMIENADFILKWLREHPPDELNESK